MNDQNMSQAEAVETSFERMALLIEAGLMSKRLGFDPSEEYMSEWRTKYGQKLRELLHTNEGFTLAGEFTQDSKKVINEIEKKLYVGEQVENR